jgi:hypothetical protein
VSPTSSCFCPYDHFVCFLVVLSIAPLECQLPKGETIFLLLTVVSLPLIQCWAYMNAVLLVHINAVLSFLPGH